MASIPIASDVIDVLKTLPNAIKVIPQEQSEARAQLLEAVTTLSEAVSQALNVASVRCSSIILSQNDLQEFREKLVESPMLLDDFRLAGVCAGLGKVRADLRTLLNMKTLSIRLFQKKQIEHLLDQIQDKERSLEEDFDRFFRELSHRGADLNANEVPDIVNYIRDCQSRFEEDLSHLRKALREFESAF